VTFSDIHELGKIIPKGVNPVLKLREMIAMGFCGRGLAGIGGGACGSGRLHAALDSVIVKQAGSLQDLESYGRQTAICNDLAISWEDQVVFRKMLTGIAGRAEELASVKGIYMDWNDISYMFFQDDKDGTIIEPLYEWATTQYHVPMYGILCAYFQDVKNPKIRSISMLGDFDVTSEYGHGAGGIKEMLEDATNQSKEVPGGQCLSCPKKDCSFSKQFDTTVFDWMKAKQKMEELEALVRDHLVMNGPTKVGSHLAYMKENHRRNFDPKRRDELMGILNDRLTPTQIQECMKFDATELLKLVRQGKVPAVVGDMFKAATSYSIDTKVSL
jgi:hypothetical protein